MGENIINWRPETYEHRPRFLIEDFDTLEPSAAPWLVKGLWPRTGVCFVAGPPGCGKSFWVLDQLARVVKGEPVLERKSCRAGAVYIAAEGANGARNRIKALREEVGALGGAFLFIGQAPDLRSLEDLEKLEAALIEAKERIEATGERLGVVTIDTLSASIPGADENTSRDMSPILTALQTLAVKLDLLILVVAHTGKDADRGLRGWSGLLGNADGLIMLNATSEDGTRGGRIEKVKDGRSGQDFSFRLDVVETGTDEDGDAITTCLVVECAVEKSRPAKPPKLNDREELMKRALQQCLDDPDKVGQVPICPGVPVGTKGVQLAALKERAKQLGLADELTNTESIRKAVERPIQKLHRLKIIRVEGDWVWFVD